MELRCAPRVQGHGVVVYHPQPGAAGPVSAIVANWSTWLHLTLFNERDAARLG